MKKNLFLNSRDQSLYWYQSHHVYTFEIGYTVCLILHQMYTLYNNKVHMYIVLVTGTLMQKNLNSS